MKKIISIFLLLACSSYADLKKLTAEQKRTLDHSLKMFQMTSKYPELWSAELDDLGQFKGTTGQASLVKYFEGRMNRDLEKYGKGFVREAEKFQSKVYRENEKKIKGHIAEAKKVFANVNKESTKKSWDQMKSIKSIILPSANEILKKNTALEKDRFALKEMGKIVDYFSDGQTMGLEDFENFTVSRSITFASPEAKRLMLSNESANVPLDIKRGIRDLNVMRLIFGKNALVTDEKLSACSEDHSKDMQEKGFFAHESPIKGKKTPWDRARNFGTNASGENIHMGSRQSYGANKGWYLSPGHFKNMFSKKNRVGLGSYGRYWTQMLGN